MRRGGDSRGYTIVEVLIFMAISGFMFVVASVFINGKQAKAEFGQGMNSLNSNIRQIINDVGNGYFPQSNQYSCTAGSSGDISFSSSTSEQGTNQGCAFLGKVVQFRAQNTDGKGYVVYTVAGRQFKTTVADSLTPINFAEAKPAAVYDTAHGVDLTDSGSIEWGLQVTKVLNGTNPIAGVGFFKTFGKYDDGGTLSSGSQQTIVVPIVGTDPTNGNESKDVMANNIKNEVTDANVVSNPTIYVCLSGGYNEYGLLTIGGANGQRLSTSIQISNQQFPSC